MDEFQYLLDYIVEFVNEVRQEKPDMGNIEEYSKGIVRNYYGLQDKKIDYMSLLDKEFREDVELYILILSVLFFVFGQEEYLEKAEELLYYDFLQFEQLRNMVVQIRANRFVRGMCPIPYNRDRKLQKYLVEKMDKEFLFGELLYTPYEERDHNLIILETDTLLADLHAPTRMVLEIYTTLRYKFGYDVLLLVDIEEVKKEKIEDLWINPYIPAYAKEYQGFLKRIYNGKEVLIYQQIIDADHYEGVKQLIHNVMGWKPECVWHIGGSSVMSEQFRKITTLVSMPCSDGYSVSDAQVMVSYMGNDKERVAGMRKYLDLYQQKMINIHFSLPYEETGNKYSLTELGIPSDAFVISIVGNRLEEEINQEFIQIMQRIVVENHNVYFLIIGEYTKGWKSLELQKRVVSYGFCPELKDLLKETQLFMNPKRKGGGGGAACAVAVGVPVLTLGDCDVANVGEAFICKSLERYPEMVNKYCNDKVFYESQCNECKRSSKRLFNVDNDAAFHQVILQVQEWLQAGEL